MESSYAHAPPHNRRHPAERWEQGASSIMLACIHGLPTKVVTLWASSVALKRALLTVMAVLEARLSVADVTHGVMLQGTTPET